MPSLIRRCTPCVFLFLWWCFCIVLITTVVVTAGETSTDLYNLLGVDRSASTQEIKKAYRRKALDTHPDKNKDVPAEEAAAAFQKVVHAFEILSDASSRNRYDRTGRTDDSGGMGGGSRQHHGGGGFQWTFRWSSNTRQARPKLKDRFSVKEAQSRILHIVSLDQLEVIMTTAESNSNGNGNGSSNERLVLERNLLICFYTPPLETHVMDEMVYPWPFAAMSTQKIWWEDLLQTTVVRYHRSNELTEFFGIPPGDQLKEPVFLFGKRGQPLRDPGTWTRRLSTGNRNVFDKWVWEQLQVKITFVNQNDHPVELYWVHDRTARQKGIVGAHERTTLTTMLAHEWWVRDARTDTRKDSPSRNKMTDATCLLNVKITSDTRTVYTIPKRTCYDLSGHCPFWNQRGNECSRNPGFMHEVCAATCRRCEMDHREYEGDTAGVADVDGDGGATKEERKSSAFNDEL